MQHYSRRTFVKGLAMGGTALGLGGLRATPGYAQAEARKDPGVLTGTAFDLRIAEMPLNITGSARTALAINGSVPGPTLRWKAGDTVTLRVANDLDEDTSIHWHGILLPARTIELHLTGHMERSAWSFDGVKFSDAEPLRLQYGERLRIVLVNDTMMSHPIHLHGRWSDLENEAGEFQVGKHTSDMPPGTRRTYQVRADALGRRADHCHLLFHMESGMFREVVAAE